MRQVLLVEEQQDYFKSALKMALISFLFLSIVGVSKIYLSGNWQYLMIAFIGLTVMFSLRANYLPEKHLFSLDSDKVMYQEPFSYGDDESKEYDVQSFIKTEDGIQLKLVYSGAVKQTVSRVMLKSKLGKENLNILTDFIANRESVDLSKLKSKLDSSDVKVKAVSNDKDNSFTITSTYKPKPMSVSLA